MNSFDTHTPVFIVRVWLEPHDNEAADPECRGVPEWRGVIEHAPSQTRRYFKNLDIIPEFIAPYLAELGIKLNWRSRLRYRLKRWLK